MRYSQAGEEVIVMTETVFGCLLGVGVAYALVPMFRPVTWIKRGLNALSIAVEKSITARIINWLKRFQAPS